MSLLWQTAYLLKGTHVTDHFLQMLSYFVQFQNITDNQTGMKAFLSLQSLDNGSQHQYMHTNHGQNGLGRQETL